MGMANYLERVMSVEFVTASLKKMLRPPKADDAQERYRRTPERRMPTKTRNYSEFFNVTALGLVNLGAFLKARGFANF